MDLELRRMALRHAAKVALGSLVLAGCGGSIETTGDAATPDASPALACTGPTEMDASVDSQAFACCLGLEESLLGDAAPFEVDAGAVVASDPSATNCCNAIIAHIDEVTADYSLGGNALALCCAALQYPPSVACTPWGPPTPPAMQLEAEPPGPTPPARLA